MQHREIIEALQDGWQTADPRQGAWYRRLLTDDGRTLVYLYPRTARGYYRACPGERYGETRCAYYCRVKVVFASSIENAPDYLRNQFQWTRDANGREWCVIGRNADQLEHIQALIQWAAVSPAPRARRNRPRGPRVNLRQIAAAMSLGITRRFGIEAEFFGMSRATAEQVLRDLRAQGRIQSGWRVKSDGSVRRWQGHHGMEVVSPPLQMADPNQQQMRFGMPVVGGLDPWNQLDAVLSALRTAGGRVDRTCGVHVHLDVSDCGVSGIKKFVNLWAANQDLIDWLVPASRRNGNNMYARRWPQHQLDALANARRLHGFHRYNNPNVAAYVVHGTIEVRQCAGTLQMEKIRHWVMFSMGMMNLALSGCAEKKLTIKDLLVDAQIDNESQQWLIERARELGADDMLIEVESR